MKRTVKSIKGLRATGHSILIELLTVQEAMGTPLTLSENSKQVEAPQAYILDIGPGIKKDEWGFEVGDRVMFSGGFVPAPNFDKNPRQRGTVDPHSIRAVLEEVEE